MNRPEVKYKGSCITIYGITISFIGGLYVTWTAFARYGNVRHGGLP